MFKKIAAAAACSTALIATPVLAGVDDVPSASIEFRDLNLSTPEGQATLDDRIDSVARQICGLDKVRTGTRIKSRSAKKCYSTAMKSAKAQVVAQIKADQRGG